MSGGPEISADYFDQWYADMAGTAPHDAIAQRHLGLPAHLLSTSLLTWDGIAEVVSALRLPSGGALLDVACGRGGYGLEVARRTGARLIGVDFSSEAIRQAVENAGRQGRSAEFRVGDLEATGLPDASVDAAMCIDAIQFARDAQAACRELRRVLRSGGRVVLTCWEARDRNDARVPERIRTTDIGRDLRAAGFVDVEVLDRPAWRSAERAMWEEAAALDPGDDPALTSFHDEGVRVLDHIDRSARVLAMGTAP